MIDMDNNKVRKGSNTTVQFIETFVELSDLQKAELIHLEKEFTDYKLLYPEDITPTNLN